MRVVAPRVSRELVRSPSTHGVSACKASQWLLRASKVRLLHHGGRRVAGASGRRASNWTLSQRVSSLTYTHVVLTLTSSSFVHLASSA